MHLIQKYFPDLSENQIQKIYKLLPLYKEWNEKINVISRKDLDNFFIHHVLHSLSIAKFFEFKKDERILDIGTGGGFPGIPLAILFPETTFVLSDSIAKKITVVNAVKDALELNNVITKIARVETITDKFDYIITRAVAPMNDLLFWSKNKHAKKIIALKGGDLSEELKSIKKNIRIIELKNTFEEDFFETKKIVVCS